MEVRFPLILDGATGTELQKRGFTGDMSAEQWTLEHPEAILDVQKGYVAAGSRVVYTPTFGANRVKLESRGLFGKTREFNLRLAALAKEAAGGTALVAGDIAPTGSFIYPMGDLTFEEMVDIHREQAAALEEAGVDLFVIETMMSLSEARAALTAVRSVSSKPVFVSVTCDENGRMLTGTDVTAALVVMQGMGVDAFGLNCSTGPKEMLAQLKRLKPYARVPLIAKPNAGLPKTVNGKTVYDCPPEEFTAYVKEMAECGVAMFGGCCGTDAGHIAALKAALEGVKVSAPAPEHTDMLPAATEKEVFLLRADVPSGKALTCDDSLEEALEDLDEGTALITIALTSEDELDILADCMPMLSKPVCFACADAELLEKALRIYPGRALYEGGLSEEALQPLAEKYGLLY